MNWEKKGDTLVHPGFISAKIVKDGTGALAEVQITSIDRKDCDSMFSAEKWAEARMNEIKKEFILSMITKFSDDLYTFGNLLDIIGGYGGLDIWTVYDGDNVSFQGTLEQCKNYIASCF